jgi:hypothetical protein
MCFDPQIVEQLATIWHRDGINFAEINKGTEKQEEVQN